MCKEKTSVIKPQQPTKKPTGSAPPPPERKGLDFLNKGVNLYDGIKNEFATRAITAMDKGWTLEETKAVAIKAIENVYTTMALADTPEKIKAIFQSE